MRLARRAGGDMGRGPTNTIDRVPPWLTVAAACLAMVSGGCTEDAVVGAGAHASLIATDLLPAQAQRDGRAVAWADWNVDGHLDLAVGNDADGVSIFEGDGEGFSLVWQGDGGCPSSLAWVDLDFDADPELIIGPAGPDCGQEDTPRILDNLDGDFADEPLWEAAGVSAVRDIAVANPNGDGEFDLLVARSEEPVLSLYLGVGGGASREPAWSWDSGGTVLPNGVAWGDVDNDGDPDLAVANDSGPNLVFANVDGELATEPTWTGGHDERSSDVAWGDGDGDGFFDLAVANDGPGDEGGFNRVHRNLGGILEDLASWTSDEALRSRAVEWADIDGDGVVEVVFSNDVDPNTAYRCGGPTTDAAPMWSRNGGDASFGLAAGDFDGDGMVDLAVANRTGTPTRVLSNGAVGLSHVWSSEGWAGVHYGLSWGDQDGDGDLDLAVARDSEDIVFRNDDGQLEATPNWASPRASWSETVEWADLDGDGDLDLLTAGEQGPVAWDNPGAGPTPQELWSDGERTSHGATVADLDRDGDLEVLVVGEGSGALRVLQGAEDGSEAGVLLQSLGDGDARAVSVGHLDADGYLDVAVAFYDGRSAVWRSACPCVDGEPVFEEAPSWQGTEEEGSRSLAWADVDSDGDQDLLVGSYGPTTLALYRNQGGQLESMPVWTDDTPGTGRSLALGDYDGDGDLDLFVARWGLFRDTLFRNDGGSFESVWQADTPQDTADAAWADVDGDGDLDLAVAGPGGTDLYRNNRVRPPDLPNTPPYPVLGDLGLGPATAEGHGRRAITVAEVLTFSYELYDHERDRIDRVLLYYALNGSRDWQPLSSSGPSRTTSITGMPTGGGASFPWAAAAQAIESDEVRIRAVARPRHGGQSGGTLRRSAIGAESAPFRLYAWCEGPSVDSDGDGVPICGGDCDDDDPTVHPAAEDLCDGLDNDCDGELEEDGDVDGDGDACADDCDEGDPTVGVSQAEVCDDAIDHDCDGTEDADRDDPDCWQDGCDGCALEGGPGGWPLLLMLFARRRKR